MNLVFIKTIKYGDNWIEGVDGTTKWLTNKMTMDKSDASIGNQCHKNGVLYQKQMIKVHFLFILSIPTIVTEDSACLTGLN